MRVKCGKKFIPVARFQAKICVCVCERVRACLLVCMYVCICVCMYVRMHAYIYIYIYIYNVYNSSRFIKHELMRTAIRLAIPIHSASMLCSTQLCNFRKVECSYPLRWGIKCIPFESITPLIPSPCVSTLYSLVIVYAPPGLKFRISTFWPDGVFMCLYRSQGGGDRFS